jgi:hypothetical protein
MSNAVAIEFPKADVRALWAQIERARRELGKSVGQAVRFGAWSVARSLGTVTKVAPKYRDYEPVKEGRGVARRKGGKKYEVTSWRKGGENKFRVRAASVSELKRMRQVRVGNAGLAKAAWMWGIKRLGSTAGVGGKGITAAAKRLGGKNMDVRSRLTGDDPFVKIENGLKYATAALRGGRGEIEGAMGKAARSRAKIIDAKVAEKMGAK